MTPKKLGRGLDALIKRSESAETATSPPPTTEIRFIDPKSIAVNRAQPRKEFDETAIDELAQSIKNQGLLQPIVVRPHEAGGLELVSGERRLRASLKLELAEIPVVVQNVDAERLLEIALIENIQREDLNPIELAQAYQQLMEQHSWTQQQLSAQLGKSRSSVANSLRFLELPSSVQSGLSQGQISAGHAKVLLSVTEEADRIRLYQETVNESLSVRALEDRIRPPAPPIAEESPAAESPPPPASTGSREGSSRSVEKPPYLTEQEDLLSKLLGTKVQLNENRGKGKIIVEFYSPKDYERLRALFLKGAS